MPARLKLNLFSPLPPLPTEIGNHTLHLVPELAARADVTLWTDQAEWDRWIEDLAPVRRLDPAAAPVQDMNRADMNIYNLGNNAPFHRGIFAVARQTPGVVVLHDTRLQHFFAAHGVAGGAAERDVYLQAMRLAHGEEGETAARRFLAGETPLEPLVERYPVTVAAIDRALAAVVHNPAEYLALRTQVKVPLYLQPLSAPAGEAPGLTTPERRATGGGATAAEGRFRLVVFGFIGANRRIASIVEALAGLPDRDRFVLDIYGRLEEERLVDEPVARHGAEALVRRHGFVPDATLDAALAGADLAINLRQPSMGEASASQLRIWRAALPSLVTRIGWYATLPEDVVFFVEPEDEVGSIRAHLSALQEDPGRFARAGRRGRAILERHHTPAGYAAALVDIARDAPLQHARRGGIDLARRGAAELLQAMDASATNLVAPALAAAIHDLVRPPDRTAPG